MKAKKKRIAVLGLTFPFRGGISHYTTILVRHLREKYTVEFYTLMRQYPELLFPGRTQLDKSSVRIVEANEPIIDSINPLSWIKAARAIRKGGFDLVVIQWWNPFFGFSLGTIANIVGLTTKVPVCFMCHNVMPHESTIFDKILSRYAFLSTKRFIVHSDEDLRNLKHLKKGVEILKNVHPSYSIFSEYGLIEKPTARKRLGIEIDERLVLYFGIVRSYKGLQYLIEAMAGVVKEIDCRLLIVGEFYDDKEKYLRMIRDRGLEPYVSVVDAYVKNEDVALYFCSCDVVVLPYVSATQSGIIQIAFGFTKPVITTDVGGLPEVVTEGVTGFIVKSRSSEDLKRAIVRFFRKADKSGMEAEIRKRATAFEWDVAVENIEYYLRANIGDIAESTLKRNKAI